MYNASGVPYIKLTDSMDASDLKKIANVKSVKVNLAKKEAIIHGDVEDSVLEEAVKKAGYEVVSIYVKKGLF